MTVQNHCTVVVSASPDAVAPLLRHPLRWVSYRLTVYRDRRNVARMKDLGEALLQDIGLESSDIDWVLATRSDVLPSHRLQALRAQRSQERLGRLIGRPRAVPLPDYDVPLKRAA